MMKLLISKVFRSTSRNTLHWTGLLLVVLLSNIAHGQERTDPSAIQPLAAFTDHYKLKSAGIPFSISATRSLEQVEGSLWQMEILASNFLGEIREVTLFSWQDCLPTTSFYGYLRKGLGKRKERQLHIDHKTNIAAVLKDGVQTRSFPVEQQVTDKLSQSLALQCMLKEGHKDFSFPVVDERGVEQYRYVFQGQETLELPVGTMDTVHIKRIREKDNGRETDFWFARQLDYALVRITQVNSEDRFELTLEQRAQPE